MCFRVIKQGNSILLAVVDRLTELSNFDSFNCILVQKPDSVDAPFRDWIERVCKVSDYGGIIVNGMVLPLESSGRKYTDAYMYIHNIH